MLQSGSVQIQAGGVGLSPYGYQHFFRLKADCLARFGFADDPCAHRSGFNGLNRTRQVELDAPFLHVRHANLREIAVQHGQHMIQGFYNGDLCAKAPIGAGQFQTDDTAANDHHALWQLFKAQRTGGVDAVGIFL